MSNEKPITIADAVAQVVAQLDGSIARDEFIARVLAIRPSKARNPAARDARPSPHESAWSAPIGNNEMC